MGMGTMTGDVIVDGNSYRERKKEKVINMKMKEKGESNAHRRAC